MSILNGFKKARAYKKTNDGYIWESRDVHGETVYFNDNDTAETKVGAIKGITTSTDVTEEGYAADATTVAALNSNLGGLSFVQDEEGNWGYKPNGADSVIPFKSGGSLGDIITIGTYATSSTQQIDCTHIPNYNVLSIDNFVYTNMKINHHAYVDFGTEYNADSYNSDTGIYTIGKKTHYVTANGVPGKNTFSINFTLKCIPYI